VVVGEAGEGARQPERFERRRRRRDGAEDRVEAALLAVDVAAEAGGAGEGVGEVDLAMLRKLLALLGRENGGDEALGLGGRDGRGTWKGLEPSVDPELNGSAGVQVDVARAALDGLNEDVVEAAAGGEGCRGRGRGRRLLGRHLALHDEQALEVALREGALGDQDLAQPAGPSLLRLQAPGADELLLGDQLVVEGQAAQEEVRGVGGHPRPGYAGAGGRVYRRQA